MILFVGDKPSKRTDPSVPFKGASCEKRLHQWIETIGEQPFYIVNSVSKEDILQINLWIAIGNPIIALGNNASKRLGKAPHFKLPHPSGRNRQINNKDLICSKLQECREWLNSQKTLNSVAF
jgi:uracil-DNA glycosylase